MHAHTGFCLLSVDRKKYSEGIGMRLDKYLKVSRLIKRRTVAKYREALGIPRQSQRRR